jgi:hypothetical protein
VLLAPPVPGFAVDLVQTPPLGLAQVCAVRAAVLFFALSRSRRELSHFSAFDLAPISSRCPKT